MGSVASFFVSRVDTEVDKRLEKSGGFPELPGKAAIANARLAYQRFEQVFSSERWRPLQRAGAKPQRPLWASTGFKDPAYDDTRYVVELVARGVLDALEVASIDYDDVVDTLERDGVRVFQRAWSDLIATVSTSLELARRRG